MSRQCLADVANGLRTRNFPEGAKVIISSCLLKYRACDFREEEGYALGGEAINYMTWYDFVTRFRADFAPVIEV